ncbi:helix-turn-helix domain-containing protein [Polyangium aurulentum]|uniref:helix-turn-helix domain-containing protein n=1 Tax=Polyangium aurulentum TaxID=2567896 RepID=UPI0010AE06B0|nr:helix-turn-helix transcriptional regulator [Polyangium aurulentum]UQA60343.1 helix-turn-helix domain-containing protein [Polyangium aurulentum]
MPRRDKPDPLLKNTGQRIRALRQAAGLTLDELAERAALDANKDPNKGHLSSVEHGRVNATLHTLNGIARGLKELRVDLADLVIKPSASLRDAIYERCRTLSDVERREVMAFIEEKFGPAPPLVPKERKKRPRRRTTSTKRKAT